MALLLERMGRLDEAESYFEKIGVRYEENGPLVGFYVRQDDVHPGGPYSGKRRQREREVFPDGPQRVTLKDFSGSPQDGASFSSSNATLAYWKLKAGDVVVAIDGYRVHNELQYRIARCFSTDPKMSLIIWRNGTYKEFSVELESRRFGVKLANYRPKSGR